MRTIVKTSPQAEPEAGRPLRVLVVEDDAEINDALADVLREEGFEVHCARDGEEGLERLRDVLPALILCDVRMPVLSGHDFLTRVRLDADAAPVPVIFLTAAAEARDIRRGMNLGADDYLTKPVSVDDLLGAIGARLQRRSVVKAPERPAPPAPTVPIRSRDDIIAGRYRLLGSAARGGMGSVYRARDLVEARDVAVKIVSRQDVVPGRFERECAILSGLTHERVVRYHAHGATEAGERYLVMDWLPGHDLARELEKRTLSVAEVLSVLRGAAEALAVVHAAGVVHRDVKPANLFLVDGAIERVTLVDNLLDVSRISAGRLSLQLEPIGVPELVRDAVERFASQARAAGSTLRFTSVGDLDARWDRVRVEQVLHNLLSNAIKYGRSSPIEVCVEADARSATVVVRDGGVGIAPAEASKLFVRFGRAHAARTFGGLGLGLFIARSIVEAHGGTLTVLSALDVGSTFTVTLPLEPERTTLPLPGADPDDPGDAARCA